MLLALTISLAGCRAKAPAEDPALQTRKQLEQELASAYPMKAPSASGVRSFDLTAAPTSVQHFDGRLLDVWAYNGRVPGPVLRVRLGESIAVNGTCLTVKAFSEGHFDADASLETLDRTNLADLRDEQAHEAGHPPLERIVRGEAPRDQHTEQHEQ